MELADILSHFAEISAKAHELFADNRGRLEQLDAALATAGMAVEYLLDEAARHQDFRDRIAKAINNGDEETLNRHRHQMAAIGRKEA